MYSKSWILGFALWIAATSASKTKHCLATPYDPSQYTCQDGALCPIVGGEPTLRCGRSCYLKEAYRCKNGVLTEHPVYKTGAYTLKVKNSIPAINGRPIAACGLELGIGLPGDSPCTYCPFNNCADMTNTTILYPNGDLKVEVPGGQQSYTNTDGSIGYTQAHSISMPPGAKVGYLGAYQDGYFVNTLGDGWMACPYRYKQAHYSGWRIFAKLDGLKFDSKCVSLNIITKNQTNNKFGAWQWT